MRISKFVLGLILTGVMVSGCSSKATSSDTAESQALPMSDEANKSDEVKTDEANKSDDSVNVEANNAKEVADVDLSRFSVGSQTVKIVKDRYEFSGSYPTFGIQAIDDAVKSEIDGIIHQEIKDFEEVAESDNHMTVDIQYKNFRATKENIDFYVFFDRTISGFAHPSSNVYTFSFDSKTGKRLRLDDFIASGMVSIDYLSKETRRLLPGIMKTEVGIDVTDADIKDCSEPKAENFRHILRRCCDKDGFTVIYDPGQVMGPYNSMIMVDLDPIK